MIFLLLNHIFSSSSFEYIICSKFHNYVSYDFFSRMNNVLVIVSSMAGADDLKRHLVRDRFPEFRFYYPSNLESEATDLMSLYKNCCDVVETESIELVFAAHKGLELVQAALVKKYPQLRGPSIESSFLCAHRYYNRQMISLGFNTAFGVIDVDSGKDSDIVSAFDETQSPAILNDAYVYFKSMPSRRIKSPKQFLQDMEDIKNTLKPSSKFFQEFLNEFIDIDRYNLAFELCAVIEQYFDPTNPDLSMHDVELCVYDDDFIPWAITDRFYWKQKPKCLLGVGIPSRMTEVVQFQVWAVLREVVQRLLPFGFDSQFIQAKVVAMPQMATVRILEMGGCIIRENTLLYRHVLQNGDNAKAVIDMGVGRIVRHPKLLPNRYAFLGRLATFTTDIAANIVDIKAAKTMSNVDILPSADTMIQVDDSDKGYQVAKVYAYGTSFEDCMATMESTKNEVLKKPDHCSFMDV